MSGFAERTGLSLVVNPLVLYLGVALGAVGVAVALPRRGANPQALGGLLAAIGFGLALLAMGVKAGEHAPSVFFYVFSLIGLGAALRVITHPRPVYAALYFILTILASAGLYLILAAEFLAFALIIIYAGAILITYLFVIMLATEAPSAERMDALSEYDRYSREPIVSAIAGFVLLGALSGLIATGLGRDAPERRPMDVAALVERMPRKVERALVDAGLPASIRVERVLDAETALVTFPRGYEGAADHFRTTVEPGQSVNVPIPDGMRVDNIQLVGWQLVGGHPLGLELAGVILLMALLGAVVLSRKQIQIEETRKAEASRGAGGSL